MRSADLTIYFSYDIEMDMDVDKRASMTPKPFRWKPSREEVLQRLADARTSVDEFVARNGIVEQRDWYRQRG